MWMLQLQRVGVSRLRRRDQEGGRERERERRRARCVGAHAAPTHAPMYAPASFRAARTAECWCGQRGGEGGGEGEGDGEERNLLGVKDEPSVPRFALHVGAIDTLIRATPFSQVILPQPPPSR